MKFQSCSGRTSILSFAQSRAYLFPARGECGVYTSPMPKHTCICILFPAVMLEMVQHDSLRMDSLELLSRCNKHGNAEQLKITYSHITYKSNL